MTHHEKTLNMERVRDLTVTVWEPDDGLDTILSFDRFFAYAILVRKPDQHGYLPIRQKSTLPQSTLLRNA